MIYRFLALDIDDTLLPAGGDISDRSREAIRQAQDAGVMVTLVSGKSFNGVLKFAQELGIELPLICHQGALVKDPVTRRVIHENLVPSATVYDVINFCRRHDLHVNAYIDDEALMEKSGSEFDLWLRAAHEAGRCVPDLLDAAGQGATKLLVISVIPEKLDIILSKLTGLFISRLNIVRSNPYAVECVMPSVSKERAVSILCNYLGVPQSETVAIGDSATDIGMLRWAGLGLAMANAPPEVQSAADHVLPPDSEDGAAYGIKTYILNGRRT